MCKEGYACLLLTCHYKCSIPCLETCPLREVILTIWYTTWHILKPQTLCNTIHTHTHTYTCIQKPSMVLCSTTSLQVFGISIRSTFRYKGSVQTCRDWERLRVSTSLCVCACLCAVKVPQQRWHFISWSLSHMVTIVPSPAGTDYTYIWSRCNM